jgi:hypothetical protein
VAAVVRCFTADRGVPAKPEARRHLMVLLKIKRGRIIAMRIGHVIEGRITSRFHPRNQEES